MEKGHRKENPFGGKTSTLWATSVFCTHNLGSVSEFLEGPVARTGGQYGQLVARLPMQPSFLPTQEKWTT